MKNKKPEKKKEAEEKSSRYISNLLQSAQRKTKEQEIMYEQNIAREQALEDAKMQYKGKEKFTTSVYKRKRGVDSSREGAREERNGGRCYQEDCGEFLIFWIWEECFEWSC